MRYSVTILEQDEFNRHRFVGYENFDAEDTAKDYADDLNAQFDLTKGFNLYAMKPVHIEENDENDYN